MKRNKKLSKRKNPIKVKKQQLIDRINSCKTKKELDGISKTLEYYPVLAENYEWDYGFLLDIIEFKLKRMREYFYTHNIVINEKQYGDICNTLINILNAGYKTDITFNEDLGNIYVNTKNARRFIPEYRLNCILNSKFFKEKYYLAEVRCEKAKVLFWKYLYYKIEYLWD